MIVLDASAAVDWLLQTSAGTNIEKRLFARGESIHVPHLLDLEVAQVLRRLAREGVISSQRGHEAIQDLTDLKAARYPHWPMLREIWRYRHNLSASDAVYVVLAETISAPLITRDARLESASGHAAKIELF